MLQIISTTDLALFKTQFFIVIITELVEEEIASSFVVYATLTGDV